MIVSHDIQVNHSIKSDKGGEAFIELDQASGNVVITYRPKDTTQVVKLETSDLFELSELLQEVIKVTNSEVRA